MNKMEFEVAFYSASGAYSVDVGGGDLSSYGYSQVAGGIWIDSLTGFKARAYEDGAGNYIVAFAGTEGLQDAYQDLASLGWDQWLSRKSQLVDFFSGLKREKGVRSIF